MKNLKNIVLSVFLVLTVMCSVSFAYHGGGNSAESGAIAGAAAINNQTFEAGDRSFPMQGEVALPALPGYFGEATKGHQFIPLKKLLFYTSVWSIEQAETMVDAKSGGKTVNIRPLIKKVDTKTASIICTTKPIDKKEFSVVPVAFGTVNATNKNSISADVFAKVLVESASYGATHILFLAEGVNRELTTEGIGIGLMRTTASADAVSTGGTGWSKGWAGYVDMPWLQFTLLKVSPVTK